VRVRHGDEPGSNGLVLNKARRKKGFFWGKNFLGHFFQPNGDRSVAQMNAPLNNPRQNFRTLWIVTMGKN